MLLGEPKPIEVGVTDDSAVESIAEHQQIIAAERAKRCGTCAHGARLEWCGRQEARCQNLDVPLGHSMPLDFGCAKWRQREPQA